MLSKEDKKDVKTHMGKALANKVHKATDDSQNKRYPASTMKRGLKKIGYEDGHRRTNYDAAGVYTGKHGTIGKAGDSYSMTMKKARKAYNNARAVDSLPKKRGKFAIK